MADEHSPSDLPVAGLRKRAEAQFRKLTGRGEERRSRSADQLVHELQVHQIELEMQNEEMRQSRLALEIVRDRYADLYDFAPVGFFSFDSAGLVVEANLTGARLLGIDRTDLIRRNFASFVEAAERGRWTRHVATVLQSAERHACELAVRRHDGRVFAARLDSVRSVSGAPGAAAVTIRAALADISDLKQAEQARAAQAERLNQMARRLALVQEEERKRLSAELHDRTSPNLAALRVNLANIADALPQPHPPLLEEILADTAALVEDATASIREISADLRPPVLDYAGLLAALVSYAKQLERRSGIAVTVDGSRLQKRPPQEHESLLFRIAVEALTNCAKHAGAKTIRIVLANAGPQVLMSIADDGVGFDEGGLPSFDLAPGHGLLTMRERAEFAGGSFHIASAPGRGTRVEVRV